MPIYEYRCNQCRKKVSILTLRVSEKVDERCEHCGSTSLTRLLSRFATTKSEESRLDSLADPSNLGEVTPLIGDIDQNSVINANDVTAMLTALTDISAYQQSKGFTSLDVQFMLDVNRDGAVNNADIQPELDLVASGGVVAPVPEPSAFVLAFLGIIGFIAVIKLHSTSKWIRT